jgi:hypothetical protein
LGGETLRAGQAYTPGKTGKKRAVYVNGVWCESLAEAAKEATRIMKTKIFVWKISRVLDGSLTVRGLEISEKPPVKEVDASFDGRIKGTLLLRYPLRKKPLDGGITHWK